MKLEANSMEAVYYYEYRRTACACWRLHNLCFEFLKMTYDGDLNSFRSQNLAQYFNYLMDKMGLVI